MPSYSTVIMLPAANWLGIITADEAYTGIQSFEILSGRFPVVLGGTTYTLPLESYMYAPLAGVLGANGVLTLDDVSRDHLRDLLDDPCFAEDGIADRLVEDLGEPRHVNALLTTREVDRALDVGGHHRLRTTAADPDRFLHAGHAGARPGGETHFKVHMVATAFAGKSRIERHRLVHAVLAEELRGPIHALALTLEAPTPAAVG